MFELVLNELSFRKLPHGLLPAADDVVTSRHLMDQFLRCFRLGLSRKWVDGLRVDDSFSFLELSSGYSLFDWRNDPAVNRDERIFFKRLVTATPYLKHTESEILFAGLPAYGMSSCVHKNGLVLSWASDEPWRAPEVNAICRRLQENGDLLNEGIYIRQVSTEDHWSSHADWVRQALIDTIRIGTDILEAAKRLYPHLEFCRTAVDQIHGLRGSEKYFDWIISSFVKAEDECATWSIGDFPHSRLPGPASGESHSVHADKRLIAMRTFQTPDGRTLIFDQHMKNRAENYRIHYYFDAPRRRLIVGYVGPHLETARY